jgi:hypothetical protein
MCCIDLSIISKYPIIIYLQKATCVSRIPILSYMIYIKFEGKRVKTLLRTYADLDFCKCLMRFSWVLPKILPKSHT